MSRLLPFVLFFAATLGAADLPPITAEELPTPASASAGSSTVTVSPDGVAWLSWLETAADKTVSFRCSTFDLAQKRWNAPRTIASGANLYAGASDVPLLTVGRDGHATALWYVTNPPSAETAHLHHGAGYHAVTSSTRDGGRTWSAPARLSRESDINEFTALATLADGRVLAVWLDARMKKLLGAHAAHLPPDAPKPSQQLYSRILGSDAPDALIDGKVCDCCHTALTAFPDGTALLAYRGRSDDETRDIRVTRFRSGQWSEARPLYNDDWRINGCPVNGPQLASDGGRVAATWFTAADNHPRVLVSFSADAGGRFLMPLRLSEGKPAGRVSTAMLHDGAILVSWVDETGALAFRRVTPDYSAEGTTRLTRADQGRIKGFPRLALLRDYAGGKTDALLLATFTREGPPTSVSTLLITVPEGALLEAARDCDCAPSAEELRGYPIRGTVAAIPTGRPALQVKHYEVPGMFAAGTTEFQIDPAVTGAEPGREFLGRFERDGNGWRLLSVRWIASAQK